PSASPLSSTAPAPTATYPLSLHDALPICARILRTGRTSMNVSVHVHSGEPRKGLGGLSLALHSSMTYVAIDEEFNPQPVPHFTPDRKSTRLNSSHVSISYAVFCLKKKK